MTHSWQSTNAASISMFREVFTSPNVQIKVVMKLMDLTYHKTSFIFQNPSLLCLSADITHHKVSNAIAINGRLPNHFSNPKRPAPEGNPGIVEVIVNVYHGTAGALYVVVDVVVMLPTTCLSISTHRLEPPVPGNVQFCSRSLKEWEESGTLWYTQSFSSTYMLLIAVV